MIDQPIAVAIYVALWYFTSFGTLLLNKHLLGVMRIEPNTLACIQMVSTAIYGALKTLRYATIMRFLREVFPGQFGAVVVDLDPEDPTPSSPSNKATTARWRRGLMQMGLVGAMRFATVVLGLVSLKHIAASFTETIKASAPFFTVVIAYFMLGEKTTPQVVLSLVPVALGLVLVSATELSFEIVGFMAAVATNVIECVQNVFSKRLLARDYTASQLQFYTSLTALLLQAPILIYNSWQASAIAQPALPHLLPNGTLSELDWGNDTMLLPDGNVAADLQPSLFEVGGFTLALLWIDGVLYHLQSVVAYVVMSYLSPVTVSVVNTVKRAILIWISVQVFGNQVTAWAGVGTAICLGGALWYNFARQVQKPAH
mmetsp:Transcript_34344/g.88046  ORF Transcript_34344/g.88046 Transcript_34344/m.88046 type:complete len:371 (+) Transcript_34344:77-1189(+)